MSTARLELDRPEALARSLEGTETLYNTYWIRFARGSVTFDTAVENSRRLVRAAEVAGVRRIVHISITNASSTSTLPYFRGKALVEQAVRESTIPHAIVKPTVVFGPGDILINNIAWFLRRFPLFPVFGDGEYRLQPVSVEDLAEIAVSAARADGDVEIDAVGPETLTFNRVLQMVREAVGSRVRLVHAPAPMVYWMSRPAGWLVRDVVITRDEIEGLTARASGVGRPAHGPRHVERVALAERRDRRCPATRPSYPATTGNPSLFGGPPDPPLHKTGREVHQGRFRLVQHRRWAHEELDVQGSCDRLEELGRAVRVGHHLGRQPARGLEDADKRVLLLQWRRTLAQKASLPL